MTQTLISVMKPLALCFALAIITSSVGSSQWEKHILKDQVNSAYSVYAADLDGDGDADVLTAEFYGSRIAWFEYIGGTIAFGPEQVIEASVPGGATAVYAADLDGDADLDVVAGEGSSISWYENNGLAGFATKHSIGGGGFGAASLYAADLDGDGDLDVLSGPSLGFPAWHENLDGLGLMWAEHVLMEAISGDPISAVDLDSDGDLDVLMGAGWHENLDGLGSFGPLNQTPSGVAGDFDGDGDMDVLSPVGWFENIDGLASFGQPQIPGGIFTADIEGDGDEDILTASTWFENVDGMATFGPEQTTSGTSTADPAFFATDLDQDGDADILATEGSVFGGGGNLFVWYENPALAAFTVQPVLASGAEPVLILGDGFDATTEVLLDDVPEPVIAFTDTQLTIQPNPADPGFRDVRVQHPVNPSVTIEDSLRLLPVLSVVSAGPGANLYVELQNGDKGIYVLFVASGSLQAPVPLADPPTWYGVLLDPAAVNFLLEINAFTSPDPVALAFPIPDNPALAGLDLYLQAWCQQGLLGPSLTYSFTNAASVTL